MRRFLLSIFAFLWVSFAYAASLLPNGEQTFLDSSGTPLAAGSVTFYIPGTTIPKATYLDPDATINNTNPVILDAAGRAIIYGLGSYRQIVKDQNGNVVWDQLTSAGNGGTSWAGTSSGASNAQLLTAPDFAQVNGQYIGFIAGLTNTGPTTIKVNGLAPISVLKDTLTGPVALNGGEITIQDSVLIVYDSTLGVFHLTSYPQQTVFARGTIPSCSSALVTNAFNVNGATRDTTGEYTINFTRVAASNNYQISVAGAAPVPVIFNIFDKLNSSFRVKTYNTASSPIDCDNMFFVLYGG